MPLEIAVDPIAMRVGDFAVHWYGIIVAVAVLVAVWIGLRAAQRSGISHEDASDAAIWVGVAGLLGSRLLYVLQNQLDEVVRDPLHAFMVWQGGLSFFGGVIASLAALAIFARRRHLRVAVLADIAAPAAALGQAIGHLGCLVSGDSYGLPASLPWAVIYRSPAALAPRAVPLHPTQLYEALALLALFGILWAWREPLARLGAGATASVYLLGLSAARFGLFFLRDEPALFAGLKTAQWLALGISLPAALALLLIVARRATVTRVSVETT